LITLSSAVVVAVRVITILAHLLAAGAVPVKLKQLQVLQLRRALRLP
jgi:hypothetical protein